MPIPRAFTTTPRMNFATIFCYYTYGIWLIAGLCLVADATAAGTTTATAYYPPRFLMDQGDDCVVVSECQLCDAAGRAEIPQCASTGRIERWKCDGEQEEGALCTVVLVLCAAQKEPRKLCELM